MKRLFLLLLVTLSFVGCVSETEYKKYQAYNDITQNGYSEFKIKENLWKVTYTGYNRASPEFSMKFMYKRIAELCVEQGYNSFNIVETNELNKDYGSTNLANAVVLANTQPISTATITCENK